MYYCTSVVVQIAQYNIPVYRSHTDKNQKQKSFRLSFTSSSFSRGERTFWTHNKKSPAENGMGTRFTAAESAGDNNRK